ncbi:MAG: hypothetical protein ABI649_06160 [Gaiellaceae bacterium]
MKTLFRLLALGLLAAGVLALPLAAQAGHRTDPRTANIHPLGHIEEPASLLNPAVGNPDIHTDIAFWGKLAIQGNWDGFNIRNISAPGNPKQISRTFCDGNQGDVVVWENIVVRSWNSNASGTTMCDGQPVPAGFEGLHVFDISDLSDPVLVASVDLLCGSHTATGVPDLANDRLLIYNSASSAACPGIDIVEVPLEDPASSHLIRSEPSGRSCHDTGVILGDAMLAGCAGGNGFTVWSLGGASGGTLEDPAMLYSRTVPGVTIGHSAAFTWDGEVFIFGHEPGGGVAAQCEATDPPSDRTYSFVDSRTGVDVGSWTLPRTQSSTENCTLHNLNVVPLRSGKYVLVHGSYQSGTSIVDFTDPMNAVELGWSDPPPVVPTDLAGAWSSYWYNGFIYETNISEGLNIFNYSGSETAGAMKLGHLNPQTQEFTIG